jgi:hypothetical protein
MCRAANSLHSGRLKWLESTLSDADLQRVVATWDSMPEAIRIAVMALVGTISRPTEHLLVSAQHKRPSADETA